MKTAAGDYSYLLDQCQDITDGATYFQVLPVPVATGQTNDDGEFALQLPSGGQFAVAACVQQGSIPGQRPLYWLVKVTLDGGKTTVLALNDDNVATAHSPESLIPTMN